MRFSRRAMPAAVAVGLILGAGCTHPGPTPPRTTAPATTVSERPPPVVVEGAGTTLELQPFTFCWVRLCADGRPPENPPDIGTAAQVTVRFPFEGWRFTAALVPIDSPPGSGAINADLTPSGPTSHLLDPATAPAGTYRVLLAGSADGRDVMVAFRWTRVAA